MSRGPGAVAVPGLLGSGDDRDERPAVEALVLPLLERAIREQQSLPAVEQFSRLHDAGLAPGTTTYRDLIPLRPPGAGQQYAFEVDLDKCTGCKACVAACHSLNGLDVGESFRQVGMLHGGSMSLPVVQTVTTACHHCLDPACLNGCPVRAYEKDPITGIVKHLDDQCIGCKYCQLTCPYEVPRYNARLGIVRKCDMCAGRLSEGEPPACVQGCPNEAIAIRVVDRAAVLEEAQVGALVPGAPSSGITAPTTSYRTARALPRNLLPADFFAVRPALQHLPLVFMLVLTQLSVGAFCCERLLGWLAPTLGAGGFRPLAATGLAAGLVALAASTAHLGRPHLAFRAVLGIRTSWLSREIVAFGLFAKLAAVHAATLLLDESTVPEWMPLHLLAGWTGPAATLAGLAGVTCSVLLYAATGRELWSASRTGFRFLMTTAVLGLSTTVLVVAAGLGPEVSDEILRLLGQLASAVGVLAGVKLLVEGILFFHLTDKRVGDLKRSALLLKGELSRLVLARYAAALAGALLFPLVLARVGEAAAETVLLPAALLSLLLLSTGEVLERMTFFAAMASPRMPGGLS